MRRGQPGGPDGAGGRRALRAGAAAAGQVRLRRRHRSDLRAASDRPGRAAAGDRRRSGRPLPAGAHRGACRPGRTGIRPRSTSPRTRRALGHAARYSAWRSSPPGVVPALPGFDVDGARMEVFHGLAGGPGWMAREPLERILRCYGIPLVETRVARSPRDLGRAADDLCGPVALKAVVPGLRHVSRAGGVRLGLTGGHSAPRGPPPRSRNRWLAPATAPRLPGQTAGDRWRRAAGGRRPRRELRLSGRVRTRGHEAGCAA